MAKVKISWNWDLFSKNPDNWEVYNRRGDKITFINYDPERSNTSKILYEHYEHEGVAMRKTVGYDGRYFNDASNSNDLVYMVMLNIDPLMQETSKEDEEELTIQKRLMFAVFLNTETNLLSYYGLTNCDNPQKIQEAIKQVTEGTPTKVHLATVNLEDHPQVKAALKAQGLTRKKH